MGDSHPLSGPQKDELAYLVHHMGPETPSRNQGSELSNATMIPQMTVAYPHQDEPAYPEHGMVPETSEPSNATMIPFIIPQMTVVVDLTRSEG